MNPHRAFVKLWTSCVHWKVRSLFRSLYKISTNTLLPFFTHHTCRYETIDGTAEAGSDYIAKKGTITFDPKETSKQIEVVIIDDYEWEPDETFFIKLHSDVDDTPAVEIGPHSIAEVTIINDDGK